MVHFPGLTTSSYKLRPPNLEQNSNVIYGGAKQRRATYRREFDIERSWIPSNKDITESMLSYSKHMGEMNRKRGIYSKEEQIELPLLIKATHLSLPLPALKAKSQNRKKGIGNSQGSYATKTRSLPNMKLEPLLGNKAKAYRLNTASLMDLKSVTGVKLQFLKSKYINPILTFEESNTKTSSRELTGSDSVIIESTTETEDNSLKETVTVEPDTALQMKGSASLQSDSAIPLEQKTNLSNSNNEPSFKSLRRLGKPKRSRRIKSRQSHLEAIDEDSETIGARLSRNSSYNKLSLPKIYNPGATVDNSYSYLDVQLSLEDRRKDVALLRKINNSISSSKTPSQISMQALAKKKLRRLPPMLANIQTDIAADSS